PAEEFAVYPVISSIMVGAPVFFLVFSGGISRYIVEAYVRRDPEDITRIASTMIPLLALASSIFLAAGLGFAFSLHRVLNIPDSMIGEARLMMILLVASYAVRVVFVPFE